RPDWTWPCSNGQLVRPEAGEGFAAAQMNRNYLAVTTALLVVLAWPVRSPAQADTRTAVPSVWFADNGDGTYKNPIIHADYSDPDVVRVGNDFYMTASSFNSAPGLPILHSKDLVNWRLINYVFRQQVPLDVFASPQHGGGVWAPSI